MFLKLAARYETTIVALAVALLAITSLRMLHYMSPQTDDAKVQETLTKNKKIRIDQKTVEKLKQLQDNGAKPPAPTKHKLAARIHLQNNKHRLSYFLFFFQLISVCLARI
jgi:hypothetical protein